MVYKERSDHTTLRFDSPDMLEGLEDFHPERIRSLWCSLRVLSLNDQRCLYGGIVRVDGDVKIP